MGNSRPSILFVTPGASTAGGNIFLLRFLRWFKENSDIPFLTVYSYGGEIEDEFKALSPAYNFGYRDSEHFSLLRRTMQKVARKLRLNERNIARKIAAQSNIGLIYSNTVINHEVLSALSGLGAPMISHCHELESVIHLCGLENFEKLKRRTSRFIAVSNAVKRNLIENHAVAEKDVELIYGFVPIPEVSAADIAAKRRRVLAELGIPDDAFVIGGSGTLNWRKAPDLFIQTAAKVKEMRRDARIAFLWIGGAHEGDLALYEANFDIEKLGLRDSVRFLPHKPDPLDYYAALDVFTLVSREDPFPLVCLEAACLGKPVICFEDAGGMPEFIADDAGLTVPYMDLDALARQIVTLYEDRDLTRRLGESAARKVRERHDIRVGAPRILKVIEEHLRK